MRRVTGGRWIVGILIVGPMLLLQLIHVGLIVQVGMAQAMHYVREGHGFTEYWARSGAAAILVRALLMLGLFCLVVAVAFGSGKDVLAGRARSVVALFAFAVWLWLLAFDLLPPGSS